MKQKNQKVSVVIPTHYRADSLNRALTSVLEQTYPCTEVIVVSDGFDQETDQLMQALVQDHPVLKYVVVDPPRGGNHARNVGIFQASSEFIAFLDDDDAWCREKIERQLRMIEEDSTIGLVCTACEVVNPELQVVRTIVPSAKYDASIQILWENCIGTTSSVLTRRSLLNQGGLFDENFRALQDYELWIRLCQLTRTGVVQEPSLRYYDVAGSNQISRNTQKYEEAYELLFNKHRELFLAKLFPAGFQKRKAQSLLALTRRAIRNMQPKEARRYACQAFRMGSHVRSSLYYLISFTPSTLVRRKLYPGSAGGQAGA